VLVLPIHHGDGIHSTISPKEVTKVALRLKYLIEQVIPYEVEEAKVTKAQSPILTSEVLSTAKKAAGDDCKGCVVFCLLLCKSWFHRQAVYVVIGPEHSQSQSKRGLLNMRV
jgi:hypothetical protein